MATDERALRAAVELAGLLERLFALLVTREGYTPIEAAVALSEELEYSEENTEALLLLCEENAERETPYA